MLNRFSARAVRPRRAANLFILTSIATTLMVVGGCVDHLQIGDEPGEGGGLESSTGTDGSTDGSGGSTQTTTTETGPGGGGGAGQGGQGDPAEGLSSITFSGGDTFNSCTVSSGDPNGLELVCYLSSAKKMAASERHPERVL
ncbi:hypothetical protein WMF30_39660 [Sorangium sp. So ce134]